MNAEQAKKITEAAKAANRTDDNIEIQRHLSNIYRVIEDAAQNEKHSVVYEFDKNDRPKTSSQHKEICRILKEEDKFEVEAQTQRHIGGSTKLTIRWI